MGMRVVMLTGDNPRTAKAIGNAAGVDEVIAAFCRTAKSVPFVPTKRMATEA